MKGTVGPAWTKAVAEGPKTARVKGSGVGEALGSLGSGRV